jgi:hypothetical protein
MAQDVPVHSIKHRTFLLFVCALAGSIVLQQAFSVIFAQW